MTSAVAITAAPETCETETLSVRTAVLGQRTPLSAAEIAKLLPGATERWVKDQMRSGALPVVRLGREPCATLGDVLAFIERKRECEIPQTVGSVTTLQLPASSGSNSGAAPTASAGSASSGSAGSARGSARRQKTLESLK